MDNVEDMMDSSNLLVGAAIFVGVLAIVLLTAPYAADSALLTERKFTIPINGSVENMTGNASFGVSAGSGGALDFGRIALDASNSTRNITVGTPGTNYVRLDAEGNITEHLEYSKYNYNVSSIPVKFIGEEEGRFTGNMTVTVQIPKEDGGEAWLETKYWFYSLQ